jgi:periplasmic divalent cation tolerance protein
MEKTQDIKIVFVTTTSLDSARQIVRILLTEKLAACCTIIQNAISIFAWEGNLNERHELMIIIKTSQEKVNEVERRVSELHSDEVPEIISVALDSGSSAYLRWLRQCISDNDELLA